MIVLTRHARGDPMHQVEKGPVVRGCRFLVPNSDAWVLGKAPVSNRTQGPESRYQVRLRE